MALSGSMIVMAMAPNNLASVLTGVPTIAASMHPALQMDVPVIGDPMMRSMWQTDCVAILVRLPVAWAVRSQAGIAWMVTTNW
jgi:hypothetical protein